jgi:hypothetical protein
MMPATPVRTNPPTLFGLPLTEVVGTSLGVLFVVVDDDLATG